MVAFAPFAVEAGAAARTSVAVLTLARVLWVVVLIAGGAVYAATFVLFLSAGTALGGFL